MFSSGSRLSENISLERENPAHFKNSTLTLSLKRGILAQARISQCQQVPSRSSEVFSLKRESHSVNNPSLPFLAQARKLSLRRESSSIVQDFTLPAGRRDCTSIKFAIAVIELSLAQLLYSFDWELPPGTSAKDLDLTEVFGILMYKKESLCVVAKPHFL
ncbi:hypothetical protein Lal_00001701 [Lupinus albus]|nr:hypothetical protein Lal_00001701 [Lupinus albus]